MRKFCAFIAAVTLLLASCNNNDLLSDQLSNDAASQMAVLAIFNGVPDSDQMEVFLNGERQNTTIDMLRYGEFMRHKTVYPGGKRLTLNVRYGNQTLSPPATDLNLAAGRNYSLLLTGGNPIQSTLVEDDLILPRSGQFKVRFVNTNPDGLTVSVGTSTDRVGFFRALEAGKISAFATYDLADYPLQFMTAGSIQKSHAFELKPANQGVYTIWLTGSLVAKDRNDQNALYTVIQHP